MHRTWVHLVDERPDIKATAGVLKLIDARARCNSDVALGIDKSSVPINTNGHVGTFDSPSGLAHSIDVLRMDGTSNRCSYGSSHCREKLVSPTTPNPKRQVPARNGQTSGIRRRTTSRWHADRAADGTARIRSVCATILDRNSESERRRGQKFNYWRSKNWNSSSRHAWTMVKCSTSLYSV